MAYDTSNPPRLLAPRFAGVPSATAISTSTTNQPIQGGNLWMYVSTNLSTEVGSSTFFSDGWQRGMRPGDILLGYYFSSAASTGFVYMQGISHASTAGCGAGSTYTQQTSSQ